MQSESADDITEKDVKAATFYAMAGLEFRSMQKLPEAISLFEKAYTVGRHHLGDDHEDLAHFLNLLVDTRMVVGDYENVESHARHLLSLARKAADQKPSLEVADALQRVAIACDMQNKVDQAIEMFKEAVDCMEAVPSAAEGVQNAAGLTQLGACYDKNGDHQLAEVAFRKAVALMEKANGLNHSSTANALHGLGCCLRSQGGHRWVEAEMAFRRSIDVRRGTASGDTAQDADKAKPSSDGMDSAVTALSLHTLADLYVDRKQFVAAAALLRKASKIRAQLFGDDAAEVRLTKDRAAEVAEMAAKQRASASPLGVEDILGMSKAQ